MTAMNDTAWPTQRTFRYEAYDRAGMWGRARGDVLRSHVKGFARAAEFTARDRIAARLEGSGLSNRLCGVTVKL